MWRVFHYFLGFHYVYWWNGCDHGIARVRKAPNGRPYFYQYKSIRTIVWMDERPQGNLCWSPLTWSGETARAA